MHEAEVHVAGVEDPMRIRIHGKNRTFAIGTDTIRAKALTDLDLRLLDLLDIAATVFAADGSVSRGGPTRPDMGSHWRRHFSFAIPVRDPAFWTLPALNAALVDTVSFMTDDTVEFRFEQLDAAAHPAPFFAFDPSAAAFRADEVVLFSGGLDSFAGALDVLSTTSSKVILLTHRSSQKAITRQVGLGQFLQERFAGRVLHVHVPAHRVGKSAPESTQRSCAFLFAALGQAVAQVFGAGKLSFFENGIISHNLPLSRQIVGSMASRTTHPLTLSTLNKLMRLISPNPVPCENRYQWLTKTEVVSRIASYGGSHKIALTTSCTNIRGRDSLRTHCGACSQCMDRRFAILANNLGDHDPAEIYETDVLFGARVALSSRTMALDWTRHALNLRTLAEQNFQATFGLELARISRGHATEQARVVHGLTQQMHSRHGETVKQVLTTAIGENAAQLLDQKFPVTSLIVMLCGQGSGADALGTFDSDDPPAAGELDMEITEPDLVSDPESALQVSFFLSEDGRPVVAVMGLGRVTGKPARVPHALRPIFEEDRQAGLAASDYRYTHPRSISDISKATARQWVKRCRSDLAENFMQIYGRPPKHNLLVESKNPRGYRLDPRIAIIDDPDNSP